jgi:hypothetical protein
MSVMQEITQQIDMAETRFGPMSSAHEAYGVLAEEMSELLEAIHLNRAEAVRAEAIQVAAIAIRLAAHCSECQPFKKRSGFA